MLLAGTTQAHHSAKSADTMDNTFYNAYPRRTEILKKCN